MASESHKGGRATRVVLITGCSAGGLGASLAERFAMKGCRTYASARDVSKMDTLSADIERVQLDVLSDDSVARAVEHVIQREGRIDILVNNAGGNSISALMDTPVETMRDLFDLNVHGVLRVTQAVVPHMAKRQSGLVINVGSIAGNLPSPWYGPYSASKAALHSLTDTFDMELRPLGIRVTLLAPGFISSNIAANNTAKYAGLPKSSLYQRYASNIYGRVSASGKAMSAATFARRVIDAALKDAPPRYMSFGEQATTVWFVSLLPRSLRLLLVWSIYSGKKPRV